MDLLPSSGSLWAARSWAAGGLWLRLLRSGVVMGSSSLCLRCYLWRSALGCLYGNAGVLDGLGLLAQAGHDALQSVLHLGEPGAHLVALGPPLLGVLLILCEGLLLLADRLFQFGLPLADLGGYQLGQHLAEALHLDALVVSEHLSGCQKLPG